MLSMDEIYRMHGQTVYRYLLTLSGDKRVNGTVKAIYLSDGRLLWSMNNSK